MILVNDGQHIVEGLLNDFDVPTDKLVWIVDFMADAAHKLADGRQLVGLLKLLFIIFFFCDVPVEFGDPLDFFVFIKHGQCLDLEGIIFVFDFGPHGSFFLNDVGEAAISAGFVKIKECLVAFIAGVDILPIGHDDVMFTIDDCHSVGNGLKDRLHPFLSFQ